MQVQKFKIYKIKKTFYKLNTVGGTYIHYNKKIKINHRKVKYVGSVCKCLRSVCKCLWMSLFVKGLWMFVKQIISLTTTMKLVKVIYGVV